MNEIQQQDGSAHDGVIECDVLICGAGLAGVTLTRQLRRNLPDLKLIVVERTKRPLPEAAHKIGESSVELGSQYLERLGLKEYLKEKHLYKHGLRFFPGGGHLPIEKRTELGPAQEPVVPSYQIDRGRFENDLRDLVVSENGAELWEGASVRDFTLNKGEESHEVVVEQNGVRRTIRCRWMVDATGRKALIRKKMKLTRGANHTANAGWYRVEGRVDITQMVPKSDDPDAQRWHDAPWACDRWRSTNHLMGEGYWAWIIPLGSGNTSIGLVVHDQVHGYDSVRSLKRMQAFLAENEPVLFEALKAHEVLDYGCIRHYASGVSRAWSHDRWALVGEAAAFVDPLYSPGTDYIAVTNTFTEEMIRADLANENLRIRAVELNGVYRSLLSGSLGLFRNAAKVYDHAPAMLAKTYWDNFFYWCYWCQFYLQGLHRLTGKALMNVVPVGERFLQLSGYAQDLLSTWAKLDPREPTPGFFSMPKFPSVLIDAHQDLERTYTPEETIANMNTRALQGEELVRELLIRVLGEAGPELAAQICTEAKVDSWKLDVPMSRIEAESTVGLARRRALPGLTRDLERTLGKPASRLDVTTLQTLLQPLVVDVEMQPSSKMDAPMAAPPAE